MKAAYQHINKELERFLASFATESGGAYRYNEAALFMLMALVEKLKADLDVEGTAKDNTIPQSKISWTGSKVGLVELIYALHAEGVFNNGQASIKDITQLFETTFAIELVNAPGTFFEIRERKSDPVRFIDGLRSGLLKRMEELEW